MTHNYQSPWFKEALELEGKLKINQLNTKETADICIVGGGYTGLWTALKIKEKDPKVNIIIIEKDLCGSGASGRNGGCMIPLSSKFPAMEKIVGTKDAIRMVKASEEAINKISDYCKLNELDAQIRINGIIYSATNNKQSGCFDNLTNQLKDNKINSWEKLSKEKIQKLTGSNRNIDGYYSPIGGSLQPALLVRGLKKIAERKGIKIFEHSEMLSYEDNNKVKVKSNSGEIECKKLIVAINAWTPSFFSFLSRSVVLVSSDMIISEPINKKLEKLNLKNGIVVLDSNLFTHYYHSTIDGRLMFGKGGNTFSFNNKVIESFDGPSSIEKFLKKSLINFFPSLKNTKITQSWNGPSERTKTGFPFFGYHPKNKNIIYGFGYSGNGILPTYVGGEILSSMALEEKNEWTSSNFCKGPIKLFPPEPFRWIGAIIIRNAVRRKENAEQHDRNPSWIDKKLSKLATSIGRVDKIKD
tara:strand:+ start:1421 stop:2830 length:1410 start_codon:yes stop_codon:yes gene_type:complete